MVRSLAVTVLLLTLAGAVSSGCSDDFAQGEPWDFPTATDADRRGDAGSLSDLDPNWGTDTSDCGPYQCGGECGDCGCRDTCADGTCRSELTGVWEGTYVCSQGLTGVTLTIEGPSEALTAAFEFYEVDENPGVPRGEVTMTGRMNCGRRVELQGDEWVDRPSDDWYVVDLEGQYDPDSETISGDVDGRSECEQFDVERRR